MTTLITLPTDPSSIPGVESVANDNGKLVVRFKNGTDATVQRSPLSRFIRREAFDVYVPGDGDMYQVAPSKSPEEVIAMLGQMAANAAKN